jgi:hypothetical protein
MAYVLPAFIWNDAELAAKQKEEARIAQLIDGAVQEDAERPVVAPVSSAAQERMSAAQIEQIIRRYLAEGKIQAAHVIAGRAARMPNWTETQRSAFWSLYQQTLAFKGRSVKSR